MTSITKVSSTDVANANDWLGYKQDVATEKGQPLDLVIPVPRSQIREISISVVHDRLGKFMTSAQTAELTIPIDKLVLNHKFMPVNPEEGHNTLLYLSAETSTSMTIHFDEYSTDYYTGGKVSWR